MGSADFVLPSSDSPNLVLVTPTPAERTECLKVNGASWSGPLNMDQYIRREEILENQAMTRNGALSPWIMVDKTLPPDSRTILSSCESFAKPAFLAHDGQVEDIIAHAVGSVFCRNEFRGKGYAKRMIAELAKVLETWQQEKSARKKTVFSVLYSDIGKTFYATHGWKPFNASHLALPPLSRAAAEKQTKFDLRLVKDMEAEDVKREMCSDTVIERYRESLRNASKTDGKAKVAIVPNAATMDWHWAREEFYIQILCPEKRFPTLKGASVPSRGVSLCWNRKYGDTPEEHTLYILKVLHEEPNSPSDRQAVLEGLAGALRRAQIEAYDSEMGHVQIWDPSPLVLEAAKMLGEKADVIHRDSSSIPCLRWGGKEMGLGKDVDWFLNERYAWC